MINVHYTREDFSHGNPLHHTHLTEHNQSDSSVAFEPKQLLIFNKQTIIHGMDVHQSTEHPTQSTQSSCIHYYNVYSYNSAGDIIA